MKKIVLIMSVLLLILFGLYGCSPAPPENKKTTNTTNDFNSGIEYSARGKYSLAIKAFDRAIHKTPGFADAHIQRAFAYYKLGEKEQSIKDIKVAADLGYKGAQEVIEESIRISALKEVEIDEHFIAYNDGTVLDTRTKLMWSAADNGDESINRYDAHSYCDTYRGGGYTDWRIPTLNELKSLYDSGRKHSIGFFTDVCITKLIKLTSHCIWASDIKESKAANFNFRNSDINWYEYDNRWLNRVVPVREAGGKDYLAVFFSGISLSLPRATVYSTPSTDPLAQMDQSSKQMGTQNQEERSESGTSQLQRGTGTEAAVIILIIAVAIGLIIGGKALWQHIVEQYGYNIFSGGKIFMACVAFAMIALAFLISVDEGIMTGNAIVLFVAAAVIYIALFIMVLQKIPLEFALLAIFYQILISATIVLVIIYFLLRNSKRDGE